jgi:DNA-3-methyladenine glycosylase II
MPITAEDFLMKQDKKLSKLISLFGKSSFALEKRQPFDALTKAVIGQQLSTSAATSITNRVIAIHGKRPFMPEKILAIDTETLRACGIANSKIKTIKGIAEACLRDELTIKSFKLLDDKQALEKLTSYWGIGNWTAEIFMMFTLKRMDVLALGDVGLQRSHAILYPDSKSLEHTAENWRPYRAIAAGYLWKFLDNPNCHPKILTKQK